MFYKVPFSGFALVSGEYASSPEEAIDAFFDDDNSMFSQLERSDPSEVEVFEGLPVFTNGFEFVGSDKDL